MSCVRLVWEIIREYCVSVCLCSMEGSVCKLPEIVKLKKKYKV